MTDKSTEGSKTEKVKAQQILSGQEVVFPDPLPDVHVASLPIAGCAWIDTEDGVVLIDTLISLRAAEKAAERMVPWLFRRQPGQPAAQTGKRSEGRLARPNR